MDSSGGELNLADVMRVLMAAKGNLSLRDESNRTALEMARDMLSMGRKSPSERYIAHQPEFISFVEMLEKDTLCTLPTPLSPAQGAIRRLEMAEHIESHTLQDLEPEPKVGRFIAIKTQLGATNVTLIVPIPSRENPDKETTCRALPFGPTFRAEFSAWLHMASMHQLRMLAASWDLREECGQSVRRPGVEKELRCRAFGLEGLSVAILGMMGGVIEGMLAYVIANWRASWREDVDSTWWTKILNTI